MSISGGQIIVLRNGVPYYSDAVATAGSDDENNVSYFPSIFRRSSYWVEPRPTRAVLPASRAALRGSQSTVRLYRFRPRRSRSTAVIPFKRAPIDCAEAYNAWSAYFTDDAWPRESYFGSGWNHVRRIAPSSSPCTFPCAQPGCSVDRDARPGGQAHNERQPVRVRHGTERRGNLSVSSCMSDQRRFKYKTSTKGTVTATRPYFLWDYDEYLIATGKRFPSLTCRRHDSLGLVHKEGTRLRRGQLHAGQRRNAAGH